MSQYKRILDHDAETGVTEIFYGSADGESYTIQTYQDVEPFLQQMKRRKNEDELNRKSEMWFAGSIPPGIQLEWIQKYGINCLDKNHREGVKRLLNSSEYSYLRPFEFRL